MKKFAAPLLALSATSVSLGAAAQAMTNPQGFGGLLHLNPDPSVAWIMAFGFLVSLRFRLNSVTHAVLMQEIDRLKAGATTPPTAENRAVVEDLTGWKYEELWGRGRQT